MKKIIKFFLNFIFITINIVNVTACKWDCTNNNDENDISCNYLLPDLKQRTNKIISDRLDFNNEDSASLKKYVHNYYLPWLHINNKKLQFINNLEEKIKFKASNKVINDFNYLTNSNNFTSFDDLQKQLNNTNLGKINVKIDWNSLINLLVTTNQEKTKIKNKLLDFYNILAQVYGKENILKLLYKMDYKKLNGNTLAQTGNFFVYNYYYHQYSSVQVIGCGNLTFSKQNIDNNYFSGWWTNKSIIEIICHEYGHALGNFICLNTTEKQTLNSLADDDPHAQWNSYFNNVSLISKKNKTLTKINDYDNYLISSLATGTKINDPIYQKLLAYGIVRSNYGRSSHYDLFAEAFAQWICTKEKQRTIAWEKLDKFFRIDLPKIL